MNNRSQETIIYGGAFNPPTRAHQAILQACVDYAEPRGADVWLLPSASRKDKEIRESREYRIDLCRALVRDVLCRTVIVGIDMRELDREKSTETYDTVQEFATGFPDRHFTWVFGADSVATMPEWNCGQWLLDTIDMLVVDRPGYMVSESGSHSTHLMVEALDISSTDLRNRLQAGVCYDELVSPSVAALLRQ